MIDRIKLNENMVFLLSLPALSPPKGELCQVLSPSKDASACPELVEGRENIFQNATKW